MLNMKIKRYSGEFRTIWDEFVSLAKNKHFFFMRDYLEYHSSRFNDFSLMIYDDKDTLIGLLPANIIDDKLISHQGLTFGGLVLKSSAKQKDVLEIFSSLQVFLAENFLSSLLYKRIPSIYHNIPSDEDLYALFRINARLIRRDVSSSIKIANQIKYSKGRKWIIKKSEEAGVSYAESSNVSDFWDNLEEVLQNSHNVKPVHSKEEIIYLQGLFPKNIKFYSAVHDNKQVAGAVVFIVDKVVHTQYLYNTLDGREVGALDGLVNHLVKNVYQHCDYFDFGISNENQGVYLNEGLISQKEGFGARAIVHDFYEIYPEGNSEHTL